MGEKKRILAIDGGGIKGVFPASFLAAVEDSIGANVGNYFDLIVGTSTGGIIALGLGLGLSAQEILAFYEKSGPLIFRDNRRLRWFRSKYNSGPLREALETCFGGKKLGDSKKRLVIPSLSLQCGEVYIYKTAHHLRFETDYKVQAVDVALATTAAPTYFPIHQSAMGTPLIDGGVWANNPVVVSVVEAIAVLEWPREQLRILSLGCTTEPWNVNWAGRFSRGVSYWAPRLVDVFMRPQSQSALGMANLFVGYENLIRIAPLVQPGSFKLDDPKRIPPLKNLGYTEARKALPKLREIFLGDPAEPFDAVHK